MCLFVSQVRALGRAGLTGRLLVPLLLGLPSRGGGLWVMGVAPAMGLGWGHRVGARHSFAPSPWWAGDMERCGGNDVRGVNHM